MASGRSSRSLKYTEANGKSHIGEVDGLQCKFCVSFRSKYKVGSKWKPTENVMS